MRRRPPGDYVYISGRKLLGVGIHYRFRTGYVARPIEVEGDGGVELGLPWPGRASLRGGARARYVDPGREERRTVRQLERVTRRLRRDGLLNLESDCGELHEGAWIWFRRQLRFGVCSDDKTRTVSALIAIDESRIPAGRGLTSLIMHGSAIHTRPPYRPELLSLDGARSGSGTDSLFKSWIEFLSRWEAAHGVALPDGPSLRGHRRSPAAALAMYRLLVRDGWLDVPAFPKLLAGAPCEGIAQVSFVARDEETTLAMASPLYIRVRELEAKRLARVSPEPGEISLVP